MKYFLEKNRHQISDSQNHPPQLQIQWYQLLSYFHCTKQYLHSELQEPAMLPYCPGLGGLHSSHAFYFASHASFHALFIPFPKATFCASSCTKMISNLFAFNIFTLFLGKLTPSTLSIKF